MHGHVYRDRPAAKCCGGVTLKLNASDFGSAWLTAPARSTTSRRRRRSTPARTSASFVTRRSKKSGTRASTRRCTARRATGRSQSTRRATCPDKPKLLDQRICTVCHTKLAGKPVTFPQVVLADHGGPGPCTAWSPSRTVRKIVATTKGNKSAHGSDRREFSRTPAKVHHADRKAAMLAWEHVLAGQPEAAPNYKATDHWWGMLIDIDKCTDRAIACPRLQGGKRCPAQPRSISRTWVELPAEPGRSDHPIVDSP